MKRSVIVFLAALMAASSIVAQDARISATAQDAVPVVDKVIPCPFPEVITIPGGTTATPIPASFPATVQPLVAGSVWNQTVADKAFGHTFRYSLPNANECCAITGGRLVVRIKAVLTASAGGANAWNDSVNVYNNLAAVAQVIPWQPGGAAAGTPKTVTIPLPASALTTGLLSIYVQDDTAVVSADLTIERCCATKRCVESSIDVTTGSNNGTAIPIGAADSDWTVQAPGGGVAQAVAINSFSSWVAPPAGSRWISSSPTASALGLYVYKFVFNLGPQQPNRECRFALQYAVDNDLTMQLDNNPPFETLNSGNLFTHFNTLHSVNSVITPTQGAHTLTVNVTNTSGPTGLLISGRINCTCKRPAATE